MKALLSLFRFTTILPFGKEQNFEDFARHSYLYPIAGYVIGALVALPVFFIADKVIAAAVAIVLLFLITGAHHFDGLLDFGDALMAHGEREKPYGVPFREGIHSFLHQYSQSYFPFIATLICLPLFLLPVSPWKIFSAFIIMFASPTILMVVSEKIFGGVNDDIVGASNELTRTCVIAALAFL
jgi:adenosylcobinamide-GDP ribazoletransferase